jgi:hypothetical protein
MLNALPCRSRIRARGRLLGLGTLALLGLSSSVAEARDRYIGEGLQASLAVGARRTDWGGLSEHLESNGYEKPAHLAPTFGVLFGGAAARFRGEILFEYSTQAVDQQAGNDEVTVEQVLFGFNLGYHAIERRYWTVFPNLGIHLLNQYVMPMPNVRPITGWSRDVTQQWGVLDLGLGSEVVVLDTRPKLVLGLRSGYLLPLGHGPWIDTKEAADSGGPSYHDGPSANPGGFYLKLTVGASFGG